MAMGLLILRSSGSSDPPPEEVSSECDGHSNLHYVRPPGGSYGSENGSDWNNAYDGFPSPTRGHTYYFAKGDYGSKSFSTAVSGTTLIWICAATTSDHGTDTGWSDTFSAPGSTSTGLNFSTSYWFFDAAVGDGSTSVEGMTDPTSYGMFVTVPSGSDTVGVDFGGGGLPARTTITVKHIAVQCHGAAGDDEDKGFYGSTEFVTVSYAWTDDCQISVHTLNNGDDAIVEYSYFGPHWSSGLHHGVQVMLQNRPIVRYNYFAYCSPQCVEPSGGTDDDMVDGQFYGNIAREIPHANGFLKGVSNSAVIDTVMYNNTIVDSDGPLLYQNNSVGHSSSGNVLYNNLLYNSSGGLYVTGLGSAPTHNYNYSINSGSLSEANGQSGSSDPFVGYAGGDFHLTGHTNAGKTDLGPPYDTDPDGNTRTTWDRGAYEYVAP